MSNMKIAHVTDEVSRAMEKMNSEIAQTATSHSRRARRRKEKTAEERRERLITKGLIKMGWGAGLSVFLYILLHSVQLKLDPDAINKIPFAVESVVRVAWTIGLIPTLSGFGYLVAGLSLRPKKVKAIDEPIEEPLRIDDADLKRPRFEPPLPTSQREAPVSVTERTTNILDRHQPRQSSAAG